VVVDVDAEGGVDALEAAALDGVALQQNHCVGRRCGQLMHDGGYAFKAVEVMRNGVGEGDNDVLAERMQQVHQTE